MKFQGNAAEQAKPLPCLWLRRMECIFCPWAVDAPVLHSGLWLHLLREKGGCCDIQCGGPRRPPVLNQMLPPLRRERSQWENVSSTRNPDTLSETKVAGREAVHGRLKWVTCRDLPVAGGRGSGARQGWCLTGQWRPCLWEVNIAYCSLQKRSGGDRRLKCRVASGGVGKTFKNVRSSQNWVLLKHQVFHDSE